MEMTTYAMDDSFYITLCSNAFLNYYPQNKPSNFINLCSSQLNFLSYDFEVGLTDLHIINQEEHFIEHLRPCMITSNIVKERQYGSTTAKILRIVKLNDHVLFNDVHYIDTARNLFNAITVTIVPLVKEEQIKIEDIPVVGPHQEGITTDELLLNATVIVTLHFKKKQTHCQEAQCSSKHQP